MLCAKSVTQNCGITALLNAFCVVTTLRKSMIVFHKEIYSSGVHSTFGNGKFYGNKMYICKTCDRNFQDKFVCVTCGRGVTKKMCKIYQKNEYDFRQFVVFQFLGNCIYETGSAYICLSCHTTLTKTNIANPIVPYHVKEGKVRDGTSFLKVLNEKPEYVCTCCHRLLFRKTVRKF